jgi:hypothetical protein
VACRARASRADETFDWSLLDEVATFSLQLDNIAISNDAANIVCSVLALWFILIAVLASAIVQYSDYSKASTYPP